MKENSIEEDIERLKLCSTNQCNICGRYEKEECMLERNRCEQHILSDYKRVLEENEQLSTEVNSLKKENEELKEERQIVGIPVRNKRDGKIGIVLHQWESGSVAVLESINPRVINTHDSWNTLEIVTDEVKQTKTKCETIPIKKIKDKIEYLEDYIEENSDEQGYWGNINPDVIYGQIEILEEILKLESE